MRRNASHLRNAPFISMSPLSPLYPPSLFFFIPPGGEAAARNARYQFLTEQPHRVFKGGREWRVDSTRFPISKTVTGEILELEPGSLRELHWHPTADER